MRKCVIKRWTCVRNLLILCRSIKILEQKNSIDFKHRIREFRTMKANQMRRTLCLNSIHSICACACMPIFVVVWNSVQKKHHKNPVLSPISMISLFLSLTLFLCCWVTCMSELVIHRHCKNQTTWTRHEAITVRCFHVYCVNIAFLCKDNLWCSQNLPFMALVIWNEKNWPEMLGACVKCEL